MIDASEQIVDATDAELATPSIERSEAMGSSAPADPADVAMVPAEPEPAVVLPPQPAPITDIWQRIATQSKIPVPITNKRVLTQLNWYKKHPSYMTRISSRAEPYLHWIVDEIEKRGLPLELALLPIVESAYDPFAYSPGRAAGMWQIIPGTAKHLGLEQNWWYDGRRDIEASTHAALNYLASLNKQFHGDWLHALAAYNSGGGRVRSAIRANKLRHKATDFWSLDLPKETENYVPKLLALSELLRNQEKYNLKFPQLPNEPYLASVNIGSQIDLALAAELAGVKLKTLQQLNPAFNHWATAPDGPHKLMVPQSKAQQFKQALTALPKAERLEWLRHKVVSGDSLIRIANKYRTTPEIIRSTNHVSGNTIRVGQHLLIPVASKSRQSYALSQTQRLSKLKSISRGSQKIEYNVKPGDNLWDISRTYNVSHRSLAKWNGMAPTDPLRIGQSLTIWLDDKSSNRSPSAITRTIMYQVRNGDSLSLIAQKFKVRVADLVKWNQLEGKRYLKPGQRLKLFVDITKTNV
jgi:membrane-bound lytic murein transglycosylase D